MQVNSASSNKQIYNKDNKKSQENVSDAKVDSENITAKKEDVFEKKQNFKPDMEKIQTMKADLKNNISAFKKMAQDLFQIQGGQYNKAINALMDIDKNTQLKAQQAISENGEWGVEQTASRILDFAKALSGGDPSKIPALKDAVIKGFEAAEEIWGGALPDICKQTYNRIMQGFDDWENSFKTSENN